MPPDAGEYPEQTVKAEPMTKQEILETLLKSDPFELLPESVLEDLAEKVQTRSYPPGGYVFKQGDQSRDCMFIVVSGLVEITVTSDRGAESVVGLRRAHDFFAETVVLSQQRYPASARVREELTALVIPRPLLERLIHAHPEFSGFFNALLAERMRLLYEEIVAEQSHENFARMESPLFRKRVSEIMSAPVITCRTTDQVTEAAQVMAERDISAIVAVDADNRPRGVLSEKSLVHFLIARRMYPIDDCRVERVMNSNLVTIGPDAFLGQAIVTMLRGKTRYLAVMERNELVGMITLMDLVRTRSTGTLLLSQDIESRPSIDSLAAIGREVDAILNTLVSEQAGVREIFDVMSELHERLSRRIIALCEERMRMEGRGRPPVEYCWINMGSAARYEQTLRTDQDNAIIHADPPEGEAESVDAWFARLSELIVDAHAQCGFVRCSGDVMATNPKWRRSLGAWVEAARGWTRSYDPEDTRILTILLDYRPIWGNTALAEEFWGEIFTAFENAIMARHMMTRDEFQIKPPISFMGTFITEKSGPHKDQIDLKRAGAVHIVNGARIFAIKNRISEPSTFGRLRLLTECGALSAEDAEFFGASFETLMMFRIRENLRKANQGLAPDNYIDPYSLRKRERMILKDALSGVSQFQKLVNKTFSVPWLAHLT